MPPVTVDFFAQVMQLHYKKLHTQYKAVKNFKAANVCLKRILHYRKIESLTFNPLQP